MVLFERTLTKHSGMLLVASIALQDTTVAFSALQISKIRKESWEVVSMAGVFVVCSHLHTLGFLIPSNFALAPALSVWEDTIYWAPSSRMPLTP